MNKICSSKKVFFTMSMAILLLLIASLFASVGINSNSDKVYAEVLSEWTSIDLPVKNNINKDTFTLPAEYKVDFDNKTYVVRVSVQDISSKSHYFAMPGYSYYLDQSNFEKDGSYYVAEFNSLSQICLQVTYVPNMLNVNFFDGLTNELLLSTTTPLNGSITPPQVPDHTADGYIFVGWSSASENIQENCTIYALYEPARYVTIVFGEDKQEIYCVAKGSKLEDIELDGEYKFSNEDGEKISSGTQVNEDMTVYAEKSTITNQTIIKIIFIAVALVFVIVVLFLIFK